MTKQELLRQTEALDKFEEQFIKLRGSIGLSESTIKDVSESIARKRIELKEAKKISTNTDEDLLIASFIKPVLNKM